MRHYNYTVYIVQHVETYTIIEYEVTGDKKTYVLRKSQLADQVDNVDPLCVRRYVFANSLVER